MSYAGIDLCLFPTGAPPKGVESNFIDPPSLFAATWGITVTMTVLALGFTVIRIAVNFQRLKASDYFVILATVLQITYSVLVLELAPWARHSWDVPACWVTDRYMQLLFSEAMVYAATTFFAKASILLLYLQLFSIQRNAKIAIWAGLIFTGILYWSAFPIEIPFMVPHKGQTWQELALSGKVTRISVWGLVQGPLSIVLDIYIFIIPFPIMTKLNLSSKRRMGVLFVFGTAFLAVVASVVGLVYRYQVVYSHDESWSNASIFLCCEFENNIAIIVSCAPGIASFTKTYVAGSSFFQSLHSAFKSSRFRTSGAKSEPSKPQGWYPGSEASGQESDRSKGPHSGGYAMDYVDDSTGRLLAHKNGSSQLTTDIASVPAAALGPGAARNHLFGKNGIEKTTEVSQHTQHTHSRDRPEEYDVHDFDPLECYPSHFENEHGS